MTGSVTAAIKIAGGNVGCLGAVTPGRRRRPRQRLGSRHLHGRPDHLWRHPPASQARRGLRWARRNAAQAPEVDAAANV